MINFDIGNKLGLYSFIAILILIVFYFMKPKPFKKVIPSLIFLESSSKKKNIAFFFRKLIKDWLFFLQLLIVILFCLATLELSAQLYLKKINNNVVFIIDSSASSQAKVDNTLIFDKYLEIAKDNLGAKNTIILVGNSPKIVATQTNTLNAYRILNSIKPTESLSNIWDSMMLASSMEESSQIIVISDMIDTNNKDLEVAKTILEAKGHDVTLINPFQQSIPNIGIVNYKLANNEILLDIKNYDSIARTIVLNDLEISISANSIYQLSTNQSNKKTIIQLQTQDAYPIDDQIIIVSPDIVNSKLLYISNEKNTNLYSAISSIKNIEIHTAQPPIVDVGEYDIYVLDKIDYSKFLPGTIDKIKIQIDQGKSLIIAAQDSLDLSKLAELLPLEITDEITEDINIINSGYKNFENIDFGLSTKYYKGNQILNNSIIIAEGQNDQKSPVIFLSNQGQGKIMFYGIFDQKNSFRLTTQYPLFWIRTIDLLVSTKKHDDINLKIGQILHGNQITLPDKTKVNDFIRLEQTGIFKIDNQEYSVNLLNFQESNLAHSDIKYVTLDFSKEKIKQGFSIKPIVICLLIGLLLLELFIIKKRGDL